MKLFFCCLILILVSAVGSAAEVEVYFFQLKMDDNSIHAYEKNGLFWHVAMKHNGMILEADPYYGVRLTDSMHEMGSLGAVLKLQVPLSEEEISRRVNAELGKKFELYSAWDDKKTTQCSKLIAQVLDLEPTELVNNKRTFSPDSLFRRLSEVRKASSRSCGNVFLR